MLQKKYRGSTVSDKKKTKERKVGNTEKKSRMIHEHMETICTDRKKNHVARRAPRAYSALSCEENREKNMSRWIVESGLLAAAKWPHSTLEAISK